MNEQELELYYRFIRVVGERITDHFEDQKEYLHCKKGCSMCCEQGQYPCSKLEYEFLSIGFGTLDEDTRLQIVQNILELKEQQKNCKDEKFFYRCPFLINNECSIYKFRPIICRTFGLAYFKYDYKNEKILETINFPFCIEHNKNYSDVYNKETNCLSTEKYKQLGYKNEPKTYNFSRNFLIKEVGEKMLNLDFGETKAIIDWL